MTRHSTTCALLVRNADCDCGALCYGCNQHTDTCGDLDVCCEQCPTYAADDTMWDAWATPNEGDQP